MQVSRILRYTLQHSLESFAADEMAIDAVIRNLEVIGEAARRVDDDGAFPLSGRITRHLPPVLEVLRADIEP